MHQDDTDTGVKMDAEIKKNIAVAVKPSELHKFSTKQSPSSQETNRELSVTHACSHLSGSFSVRKIYINTRFFIRLSS